MSTKNIKAKKISVSAFEKVMKETNAPADTVEWNGVNIAIKKTLSLKEVLMFVDSVTKSCFASDTGEYLPEVKMFAIKCCVLELYANFALPANVERRYELIYNTDAYDVVINNINTGQFIEILNAIDEKIKNAAQANIETINTQMNEVYKALDNLQQQVGDIFDGINPEDVSRFLGAVSSADVVGKYIEQEKADAGE